MTRLIGGTLQRLDHEDGQALIGGERFALQPGLRVPADIGPGTGVVALVSERGGVGRIVRLRPSSAPRFIASAC
jgi:hypothetical protein